MNVLYHSRKDAILLIFIVRRDKPPGEAARYDVATLEGNRKEGDLDEVLIAENVEWLESKRVAELIWRR